MAGELLPWLCSTSALPQSFVPAKLLFYFPTPLSQVQLCIILKGTTSIAPS